MSPLTPYKAVIALALLGALVAAFVACRTKRKELALALGTVVFCLFAGEVALRLFFPQISDHNQMFQYDADLGWKFVPNQSARYVIPGEVDRRVTIGPLGFRDRARDLAGKRDKRILVLGDSFVSNVSVEEDQVFTRIMERQLPHTEVLNFGVNGYGQVQEYLLLKSRFAEVNPDLVMVVIYIRNDFQDNVDPKWTYGRPFVSLEGPDAALVFHPTPPGSSDAGREPAWKVYRRSHVFTLINQSLERLLLGVVDDARQALAITPQELTLCRKDAPASMDVMFMAMTKLAEKFKELSSARGVPVVFVLAPSDIQVYDDLWLAAIGEANQAGYDRSLPNQRLMQFAAKNGLMMVDLLPALLAEGVTQKALYRRIEQHWTREGNQLVARVLVDYLQAAKLSN